VDQTRQIYVIKRGTGAGYAGIQNALFYEKTCNMVYGDAAAVLAAMIEAVRGLGKAAA
jgi:NAD(P) transhydrogenase subunit beta